MVSADNEGRPYPQRSGYSCPRPATVVCQTELTESWKGRCFGFAQHPQCLVHIHVRIMLEWLRRSMMRWSTPRVTATILGSTSSRPRVSSARRRHSEEPNRTCGPRSSTLEAILAKSILVVVCCNHLSACQLTSCRDELGGLFPSPDLGTCAKPYNLAQRGRCFTISPLSTASLLRRPDNMSYLLAEIAH